MDILNQNQFLYKKVKDKIKQEITLSLDQLFKKTTDLDDKGTILSAQMNMVKLFDSYSQSLNRLASYKLPPVPDENQSPTMQKIKHSIRDAIRNTDLKSQKEKSIQDAFFQEMDQFLTCYNQNIELLQYGPPKKKSKEDFER